MKYYEPAGEHSLVKSKEKKKEQSLKIHKKIYINISLFY